MASEPITFSAEDFARVARSVKFTENLSKGEVAPTSITKGETFLAKRFVLLEHLEEGGLVQARGTTQHAFPTGWDVWAIPVDVDTLVDGTFKISVTYSAVTKESNAIDVDDAQGTALTACSPIDHVGHT